MFDYTMFWFRRLSWNKFKLSEAQFRDRPSWIIVADMIDHVPTVTNCRDGIHAVRLKIPNRSLLKLGLCLMK